jgi:leucyl-tRNA synthetase
VAQARRQSEIERTSTEKERTGVFIGAYAINPMNDARVPIYIADYVLTGYGTGAIMAVPAHDARDFDFAHRYGLPTPVVIAPPDWAGEALEAGYTGYGQMINSGSYSGMTSEAGFNAIADEMGRRGIGERKINYRLHDWLISRQRYWGAPIPIIYCPTCGVVPVAEKDLPVLLPEDAEFMPTGESPLKYHAGFLHTTCPRCGGPAERETDTMDTFMCSSWYQYRYLSPDYAEGPFDPAEGAYWLPVDQYTGGIEHATMHLLYTRFFTKAMRDIGLVNFGEPMLRLFNQGIILGEDSEKMSKSRGNVVNPDDLVAQFGADTVRVYLMFIGPWEEGGPWNSKGIEGSHRFLQRVWTVTTGEGKETAGAAEPTPAQITELRRWTHKTIRRVTRDMEGFQFNTMLAGLMEFNNYLMQAKETAVYGTPAWDEAVHSLALMLAPAAPHIAEEIWERLGQPYSVHQQSWPAWEEALTAEEQITLIVQVNGKVRDKITAPVDIAEEAAKAMALASAGVQRALAGKTPDKVFYVAGKLVNIVVR